MLSTCILLSIEWCSDYIGVAIRNCHTALVSQCRTKRGPDLGHQVRGYAGCGPKGKGERPFVRYVVTGLGDFVAYGRSKVALEDRVLYQGRHFLFPHGYDDDQGYGRTVYGHCYFGGTWWWRIDTPEFGDGQITRLCRHDVGFGHVADCQVNAACLGLVTLSRSECYPVRDAFVFVVEELTASLFGPFVFCCLI